MSTNLVLALSEVITALAISAGRPQRQRVVF